MRTLPATLLAACLILSASAGCASAPKAPPNAMTDSPLRPNSAEASMAAASRARTAATRKTDTADILHGDAVPDPWRWLEDEKDDEVQAWMAAEDALARRELERLPAREALSQRMRKLFYADSSGVPVQRPGRLFFMRTYRDKEKAVLRVRDTATGEERTLLDPNGWSADGAVSLGEWNPSPDGRKVAFTRRPNAADEAVMHVIDVETGVEGPEAIEGAKYAWPSWSRDSSGFWYGRLPTDASIPVDERPGHAAIYFHRLGEDWHGDALVHGATGDPKTFIDASASRDGGTLFVSIQRGWSENDLYALDLSKPVPGGKGGSGFQLIAKGEDATFEYVDTFGGHHYFLTNQGAPNKRVMRVRTNGSLEQQAWEEAVPERPEAVLDMVRASGGRLLLSYFEGAESRLRLADADGKNWSDAALPGIGSVEVIRGDPESPTAFYSFTSFAFPREVRSLEAATGASAVWASSSAKEAFDAESIQVEKVLFSSKDGTQIPLFIVGKKGTPRDGTAPTLLYGYGGFMVSMTPRFRAGVIPWIEAGGIYAVPCLRGGGEFGKKWHDAGRGKNKQNVFDDFTGAAQWLTDKGYTSPDRLTIYGGSNGGLLVGAAMVQRPDLFRAVLCAVPLLDMLRYQLFGSGRTWIPEYGTAEKAEDYRVLKAYSPYSNVRPGTRYPALLMLSADHDDRVDPMHARKFVAAVRDASPETPVLLRIEKNSGHGGADQVEKAIAQNADMFAFLMALTGMTLPEASR